MDLTKLQNGPLTYLVDSYCLRPIFLKVVLLFLINITGVKCMFNFHTYIAIVLNLEHLSIFTDLFKVLDK